jgi:hypothetical protein
MMYCVACSLPGESFSSRSIGLDLVGGIIGRGLSVIRG